MYGRTRRISQRAVLGDILEPQGFLRVDTPGPPPYGLFMAVRAVVVWPDVRLSEKTRPVAAVDDRVRELNRDLCDTMYAENGLSIAAIQIGDPTQMFLVEPKLAGRTENDPPVAFINPEVVWTSEETQ